MRLRRSQLHWSDGRHVVVGACGGASVPLLGINHLECRGLSLARELSRRALPSLGVSRRSRRSRRARQSRDSRYSGCRRPWSGCS